MEIERKWLVTGWPKDMQPQRVQQMEQGYIVTRPTVRIRREAERGGATHHILCFKGKGTLSREEIEAEIEPALFDRLAQWLDCPLIIKERRDYRLPDGHILEVNAVDEGAPTSFFYAEVEFISEEEARAWQPDSPTLAAYLQNEVTGKKGVSMAAYWERTRHVDL